MTQRIPKKRAYTVGMFNVFSPSDWQWRPRHEIKRWLFLMFWKRNTGQSSYYKYVRAYYCYLLLTTNPSQGKPSPINKWLTSTAYFISTCTRISTEYRYQCVSLLWIEKKIRSSPATLRVPTTPTIWRCRGSLVASPHGDKLTRPFG